MSPGVVLGLTLALLSSFASVVLGRNLARSITAGVLAVAGLSIALVSANAGFVGFVAMTVAALVLLSTGSTDVTPTRIPARPTTT